MEDTMKNDIKTMIQCYSTCTKMINHCLKKGGEHANADHIRVLMDCAKICQTAIDFALRGSAYHTAVCGVCADVCNACADSCENLNDDEEMQKCIDICRNCAEACERMSS